MMHGQKNIKLGGKFVAKKRDHHLLKKASAFWSRWSRQTNINVKWRSGKGKVHCRTRREGSEGEQWYGSTLFLTSALDGDEWSWSRTGRPTLGKYTRCVGPRTGMDGCGKCRPHRNSIPGPSSS